MKESNAVAQGWLGTNAMYILGLSVSAKMQSQWNQHCRQTIKMTRQL